MRRPIRMKREGPGVRRGRHEAKEDGESGVSEAGGLIGRKLSARAILRRIRDSPGSYPSRPLLDSSDVHRLPARRIRQGFSTRCECFSRRYPLVWPSVSRARTSRDPTTMSATEGLCNKRYCCTYPNDSIKLGHGHLLGSFDRCGNLLLMLL